MTVLLYPLANGRTERR